VKGRDDKVKRGGSILAQFGAFAMGLFAVMAIVVGYFTWSIGTENYINLLKRASLGVLVQAGTSMQEYESLPWLLDYWQGHASEMNLRDDAGERGADVAEMQAELGVGNVHDVSVAQVQGFPPAAQRRFAEQCYLDIDRSFKQLISTFELEDVSCAVFEKGGDVVVPLFQVRMYSDKTAQGNDYALGEVWPFDPKLHPVLKGMIESGDDLPDYETVKSSVDGRERLTVYLPIAIDDDTRCYLYTSGDMDMVHESINEQLKAVETANFVVMVVSAALLLWFGRSLLRRLAVVQDEVRAYRVTKDVDAAVQGLAVVDDDNEIGRLAQDVSELAVELDRHVQQTALMSAEKERIDTELELARQIQRTSLPNVFPPYPERHEVGLFASMDAAREVGGDFYDFFLVDEDKLAVIVADVSDKGIPAALFMMRSKAAIKHLALSGLAADEVMTRVNDALCTDNEAGMFVTAWLGILDLRTGVMEYVHAGHTCPALVSDGVVSYVKQRRDFIVGGRAGMSYHRQELRMKPGDTLFLYSDGVTEAFGANDELYGSEGLERVLARVTPSVSADDANEYCKAVCMAVKDDLARFTQGVDQSDDITMLCIRYEG